MIVQFVHAVLYISAFLYFLAAVGFYALGNTPMAISYIAYTVANLALAQLA